MIELLFALLMNDALHDFGLIPYVDYDPIEVVWIHTLHLPITVEK